MEKIIYVKENGICRFVSKWRERKWWRKSKVWTDPIMSNAHIFEGKEEVLAVTMQMKECHVVAKDDEIMQTLGKHRFWVICNNKGGHLSYYQGMDSNNIVWTDCIEDAMIDMSQTSALDSASRLRSIAGLDAQVSVHSIWLEKENPLLHPRFMITCTSKGEKQETKYFSRVEGNCVRLVNSSFAATTFTYDDVLSKFEALRMTNKDYLYAIFPKFDKNVNYRDIEKYMATNKVPRMVITEFRLKKRS